MEFKEKEIVYTVFKEHPIVDYRQAEPNQFDISSYGTNAEPDFRKDQVFDHYSYCEALIRKLLEINLKDCKAFLEYNCKKLKSPQLWLSQVEELIDQNNQIFSKESCRYAKLSLSLNLLIEKSKTLKAEIHHFDFEELKERLDKMDSDHEKLQTLHNIKIDFLIYNTKNINALQDCFVKKVDLERDRIIGNQALSGQPKGQMTKLTFSEMPPKLKMNCNINVIADVFFKLITELDHKGKTRINASPKEATDAICAIFLDKSGNPLVPASIETMLSPNKYDKRPKGDKGFNFSTD